jgi:hypothetical protein
MGYNTQTVSEKKWRWKNVKTAKYFMVGLIFME